MFRRDIFSDTEERLRKETACFLDEEIVPFHDEWTASGKTPRDVWRKAGSAGLLCRMVPAEYGGRGASFLDSVVIVEELARRRICGLLAFLQSDIVAPYLWKLGTPAQKERFLPGLCSGETIGAVAMTEPSSGSDLKAMKSSLQKSGAGYVLDGEKTHISNGSIADLVIVAALAGEGAVGEQPGISLVLVEGDRPGFGRSAISKSGMRALDTGELRFSKCTLPRENLLGAEGLGFLYLMTFLSIERLMLAVYAQAWAETMLSDLIRSCEERRCPVGSILDFQNTRFLFAGLYSECAVNRAFVDRCVAAAAGGRSDAMSSSVAKLRTAETLKKVAQAGVQFRGANGVSGESGTKAIRDLADSAVQSIWGGTSEVMSDIIGSGLANTL